ncbi:hypothetical protein KIL84_002786 [Mauremys mutica]|uniref:Uncharacterized protein n=1 Tax=Mauremys mutica TaxID=74926 RepID=A0A9D3WTY7_9SAUR|nr:hypothetical protein KIL84_002786 [Mauremys mutica]
MIKYTAYEVFSTELQPVQSRTGHADPGHPAQVISGATVDTQGRDRHPQTQTNAVHRAGRPVSNVAHYRGTGAVVHAVIGNPSAGSSTISNCLSAITFVSRLNGYPDPCGGFLVQRFLVGWSRSGGRREDSRHPSRVSMLRNLLHSE